MLIAERASAAPGEMGDLERTLRKRATVKEDERHSILHHSDKHQNGYANGHSNGYHQNGLMDGGVKGAVQMREAV
jgi:hypothetical protein